LLTGCIAGFAAEKDEYKPGPAPFGLSKWAKDVSLDNVLPEYPRPMMKRNVGFKHICRKVKL